MSIVSFWNSVNLYENKHPIDIAVLKELESILSLDFNFDFPPGPYFGPITTAKVILCYANPSDDIASRFTIKNSEHIETLKSQLGGRQDYPYQLDGWANWFKSRANTLFNGNIELASKNIAVLNLIPYASPDMTKVGKIANCLPSAWQSQKYLRETLIPKAENDEILLIMCRAASLWGLRTSVGSKNILINSTRSGFSSDIKLVAESWIKRNIF
ncbi:hypothetical protein ABN228_20535 [Providencia rettgeri]|uniref:Uncharacterized protein n=1 Tax=Pectobacterium carotovorum TaxID=554 RepID=A0A0N9NRQ1_PECCA|nr:Hypothetical protein [Pectobacterium carotovorum]HEP0304263.1 hypothetical protein [Providencia rettgeri]